jgi:3-deoxy-D-manno-octulosonic-acid transferase
VSLIYTFLIRCYGVLLHVASWFHPKAKAWVLGRQQWEAKLRAQIPVDRKVLWFHCASLGEFDQGLPLMKSMKEEDPNLFLLVSFFSPSGMEHYQKREPMVDAACYLPLDTLHNARTFVQIVQPVKAVFVKYEFWPNFLRALAEKDIETIAVSAIFRPKQIYFRWYGGFFRSALKHVHHFHVQNEASKNLLESIGIQNSTISGDLRYKRVFQAKELAMQTSNELLATFTSGFTTLILGSSWPREEGILRDALPKLGTIKLIIAPHDVSERHIAAIQADFPNALRYTELDTTRDAAQLAQAQILIIDTIGQLSSAYRYGTIAFIGGGFTGNLHNILEPAVYGLPLLFGPKHSKFPEAELFLQKGFALEVTNATDFSQAYHSLLEKADVLRMEMEVFVREQV